MLKSESPAAVPTTQTNHQPPSHVLHLKIPTLLVKGTPGSPAATHGPSANSSTTSSAAGSAEASPITTSAPGAGLNGADSVKPKTRGILQSSSSFSSSSPRPNTSSGRSSYRSSLASDQSTSSVPSSSGPSSSSSSTTIDDGGETPADLDASTQSLPSALPSTIHVLTEKPSIKFAPLPSIAPRKRKSSTPLGIAARGQMMRRRRMLNGQYNAQYTGPPYEGQVQYGVGAGVGPGQWDGQGQYLGPNGQGPAYGQPYAGPWVGVEQPTPGSPAAELVDPTSPTSPSEGNPSTMWTKEEVEEYRRRQGEAKRKDKEKSRTKANGQEEPTKDPLVSFGKMVKVAFTKRKTSRDEDKKPKKEKDKGKSFDAIPASSAVAVADAGVSEAPTSEDTELETLNPAPTLISPPSGPSPSTPKAVPSTTPLPAASPSGQPETTPTSSTHPPIKHSSPSTESTTSTVKDPSGSQSSSTTSSSLSASSTPSGTDSEQRHRLNDILNLVGKVSETQTIRPPPSREQSSDSGSALNSPGSPGYDGARAV